MVDYLKAEVAQVRRQRIGESHAAGCLANHNYRSIIEKAAALKASEDAAQEGFHQANWRRTSMGRHESVADKRGRRLSRLLSPAGGVPQTSLSVGGRYAAKLKVLGDPNSLARDSLKRSGRTREEDDEDDCCTRNCPCTLLKLRSHILEKMEKDLSPWQAYQDKQMKAELAKKLVSDAPGNKLETYVADMSLSLLSPRHLIRLYKVGTFTEEPPGSAIMDTMQQLFDRRKYLHRFQSYGPPEEVDEVEPTPPTRFFQLASDLVKSPGTEVFEELFSDGFDPARERNERESVQRRLNSLREVGSSRGTTNTEQDFLKNM